MGKILWYFEKLLILAIVCVRILIYCIFHPKKFFSLSFSMFSTINEFYQVSHGKLKNFLDTEACQKITQDAVAAQSIIFNADSKVTRSIETQVMSTLVKAFNPKTIFEIGTYNGYTTLHLAKNSSEDCKIYTLDLPPDFEVKEEDQEKYSYDDMLVVKLATENIDNRMFKNHPEGSKITELFGDSTTFDYSPYRGKMDFIFIDGNHSYEFVKSDTENAMDMLSENGIIVWHDFDYIIHRDVFKYLNELSNTYNIFSIPNTRFAIYGKNLI